MIGSLYWDDESRRKSWRQARLNFSEGTNVTAPIRYGRKSDSRGCSYTMVFSPFLRGNKRHLGTAVAVPCKRSVRSIEDLIHEAEWLWAAEAKLKRPTSAISAQWGCVGLLLNPNGKIPKELLIGWRKRVSEEIRYGRVLGMRDEKPIIDSAGYLNIDWPSKVGGGNTELDILLATATDPTPSVQGVYPTSREIAEGWKTEDGRCYVNYFWCNRKHNITTFQDADIQRHLTNN